MQNRTRVAAQPERPASAKPGRPRDERIDEAIIAATVRLVAAHGVAGLSVDAVAASVGCSKATIYRRWRSKEELVVEALRAGAPLIEVADTGSLRGDLERYFDLLIERLSRSRVDVLPNLVHAGTAHTAMRGSLNHFNAQREEALRHILARGIARGDLPHDVNCDAVVDALVGPVRYRHHFSGRVLDRAFAQEILDLVLAGLREGAVAHATDGVVPMGSKATPGRRDGAPRRGRAR